MTTITNNHNPHFFNQEAINTPLTDKQLQYTKKLGILDPSVLNLEANKGIISFIETNALHKKMEQQGHKLQVNENGEVLLLMNGHLKPWPELKNMIENKEILLDSTGKLIETKYTYQGLVNAPDLSELDIDALELEELIEKGALVFQEKDPQDWNHEFVMSIVTQSHPDGPEKAKEHSWFHFKHPDGRILSIGLYRTKYGLETQPGRVERVDDYESYSAPDGVRDECNVRVGKEKWEKELKKLLNIAKKGPTPYHQIHGTCASVITQTFNNATNTHLFNSSLHLIELAPKHYRATLLMLPGCVIDLLGSALVKKADRAIDISTLTPNELEQGRMINLTNEERTTLQQELKTVAAEFAKKTAHERSQLDHPFQLRKKGLEIAAYRQEKIEQLKARYQTIIEKIENDHGLSPERKEQLIDLHRENFEETRNFMKLDLPPRSWSLKRELPLSHPDYSATNL